MPRTNLNKPQTILQKIINIPWLFVWEIVIIAAIGFAMLYSAAGGEWGRWAMPQLQRFVVFFVVMLVIALIRIEWILRFAYIAYAAGIILLLLVEFSGTSAMGAKRWVTISGFTLQPSELMKVLLVVALARYFHCMHYKDIPHKLYLVPPLLLVLLPVALVLKQPDLGTAIIILAIGGAVFFLAGIKLWKFGVVIASGLTAIPFIWHYLHDYQKKRILTFLNPESDPLGAGYNILQSQIAIGSGGFAGKGFLSGSQNQLNFLPEKHTDFVFTMLTEELGFLGGVGVILLYAIIITHGIIIALNSENHFGRLLASGVMVIMFLHVFINIAMVMGMIPVVGAPLPFLSFGGTMLVTMLAGCGLVLNTNVNRNKILSRNLKKV